MPGGGVVHAPLSWIAEFADLPAGLTALELGDAFVRAGLEVERIDSPAQALSGPIVIGQVVSFVDEPQSNGKTIRWCTVDVGESTPRGIVCGASNFSVGDLVVVALAGAVLPGGFEISARKTYGHVSDGMICSGRELGVSADHAGILVLSAGSSTPGSDALDALGLRETVFEIAVTPDRGYCLSMRGLAREASIALEVAFHDVADAVVLPVPDDGAFEVVIDDLAGCDQFSARVVSGLDPQAPSPDWMQRRLRAVGMRSISLVVDVTNYVMLETGQPLHAFDRSRLTGSLGVRRARGGEKLTTLDDTIRSLDSDDLVVTDETGPIALAGVMGGASTEITSTTTDVVLEAAHWDPSSIARAVRRHRLPSEAAKRFERGVDPAIAGVALQRCVDLLVEYGRATASAGYTIAGTGPAATVIALSASRAARTAGMPIDRATVLRRLRQVGCVVAPTGEPIGLEIGSVGSDAGDAVGEDALHVTPPTWRPDLVDPADLVEEVIRLEGYEKVPSALPTPPPGRGLTDQQLLRRAVSRALASAGYIEVLSYPFLSPAIHDVLGLAADDPRRRAARLVNPLSDAEPELRTSLLPGLLASALRNLGRGNRDFYLFEMGLVYLPGERAVGVPRPGVTHRPSGAEIDELNAAIPQQPRHVAVVLTGEAERSGWWGPGRKADWSDAIEAARTVARVARVRLDLVAVNYAPWHPGRSAQLLLDGKVIGHAGELHPRVIAELGLPERVGAMELDLDAFAPPGPVPTPSISTFPPVLFDLALVVPAATPSAAVLEALREGAGDLLESVRLFDAYTDDDRLGVGMKSLAFALRLRAPDRTLTSEEATAIRDSALALAATRVDARLRS